jgi:sulfite exporter TauE/SafE
MTASVLVPATWLAAAVGAVALGIDASLAACPLLLGSPVLVCEQTDSLRNHAARYHAGRVVGYAIVGFGAGLAGLLAARLTASSGLAFEAWTWAAVGTAMVVAGLSVFVRPAIGSFPLPDPSKWLGGSRSFASVSRSLSERAPCFGVGLFAGTLPCVPLVAVSLIAFALASPLLGAGMTLLFGVGTFAAPSAVFHPRGARLRRARRSGLTLATVAAIACGGAVIVQTSLLAAGG